MGRGYIIYNQTKFFRIGTFYPESDTPFDPLVDCSEFWRYRKIKIKPMNFTSEEYMDNIKRNAYIGMGLNIAVVTAYLLSFSCKIMKKSGSRRKFKFFIKILNGFVWSLVDSITGSLHDSDSDPSHLRLFKYLIKNQLRCYLLR